MNVNTFALSALCASNATANPIALICKCVRTFTSIGEDEIFDNTLSNLLIRIINGFKPARRHDLSYITLAKETKTTILYYAQKIALLLLILVHLKLIAASYRLFQRASH